MMVGDWNKTDLNLKDNVIIVNFKETFSFQEEEE